MRPDASDLPPLLSPGLLVPLDPVLSRRNGDYLFLRPCQDTLVATFAAPVFQSVLLSDISIGEL
ncbi:hypothetical protein COCSUDRAFT_34266 [Coccomyxa subellipsoidea C-169]|uniref:Uncharacterized protein n=1 Tax=Coccomyxa subellipsoidea (strain C-169) TaxID=574566 RepID=I0YLN9_COCSC|nr:hypothetical protein COCSUDRAFT_34266 [Coccomyxa subellipsoidea C-169]EIE19308.1 hypothetical protein COCSUDRAFT_34266 [Coccomyxa subellipsoidea C-169]|eukprot:XP_005643852.1 hypothetical protein COCSUDRAFT_34266 [Coccomyxa subellipsoidea C-169]